MIDLGQSWETAVSHSLAILLNLGVLGSVGRSQHNVNLEEDAKTQGDAASTQSGITGLPIGDQSVLDLKTLMISSGNSPVGNGRGKESAQLHNVLFDEIKTRTVGDQKLKSRNVHKKIKNRELPPLLPFKADNEHMCLAWHTKDMYNPESPCAADYGATY